MFIYTYCKFNLLCVTGSQAWLHTLDTWVSPLGEMDTYGYLGLTLKDEGLWGTTGWKLGI